MNDFTARWLKLSLVALVGCGFLAMLVYALLMKDEIRNSQIEPPLLVAPEEPVKRRPDEPGGLAIPHQDKTVFDLLEHPSPTDFTSATPIIVNRAEPVSGTTAVSAVAAIDAAEAVVDEKVEEVAVAEPTPVVAAKPVETKPEPVKVEPKPEPKAEPVKAVASGGWGVQVASLGTQADADRAIANLKGTAALKGLTPKVVKADLGAKGVKYRVQFVGLKDRAAAVSVCGKMGKQACLPVENK
jgi:cell division septation protein DedD